MLAGFVLQRLGARSIMLVPVEDPQRLRRAGTRKSKPLVKVDGPAVRQKCLLVEPAVPLHHPGHQLGSDSFPLVLRSHDQVGEVDHQVTIRDRIPKANEQLLIPSGHERMGGDESSMESVGLVG